MLLNLTKYCKLNFKTLKRHNLRLNNEIKTNIDHGWSITQHKICVSKEACTSNDNRIHAFEA